MILYGSNVSAPSYKVRYVLEYLQMEYEYRSLNLRQGEQQTEGFRKMHPAGKIPVLDDDGFVLFESNAIIRYLSEKAKSRIYPLQDLKWRSLVNQWIDFVSMHVGNAINKIMFNRVFAPMIPMPVDQSSITEGFKFLNRFLPVLENQLQGQDFVVADQITLADFVLLAILDPVEVAQINLDRYPEIGQWRMTMKQQNFYSTCYTQEVVDYSGLIQKLLMKKT